MSLPPIDEPLKRDAIAVLRETLRQRRQAGVIADGTRPTEWTDNAQTVGWCRDLMERWPPDALRTEMTELLAHFGYPEYANEGAAS